ncbi:MAG: hypothetical protein KC416_17195, partial [Myxococcales bacterium]|nr:hypothetical protein [Myxococcales bacterium]
MGCLVTEQIDFPVEENLPPKIIADPERNPLQRILVFNLGDETTPGDTELEIVVTIRDPNVEDELQWRAFMNLDDTLGVPQGWETGGRIQPSSVEDRPHSFQVPGSAFGIDPGCRRIDLLVSKQFRSPEADILPVEPGDIDRATWWVNVRTVDEGG